MWDEKVTIVVTVRLCGSSQACMGALFRGLPRNHGGILDWEWEGRISVAVRPVVAQAFDTRSFKITKI